MKKGFTLIELLAIIVILSIIALITVPIVIKIIDKSILNSFEVDTNVIFRAIDYKLVQDSTYDFNQINAENIEEELNISKTDYQQVSVRQLMSGENLIVVKGQNKWDGLIAYGTETNIKAINTKNGEQYENSPTIVLNGTNPVWINIGDEYSDLGAVAFDEGGNSLDVYVTGQVNTEEFGSNTVTYYTIDNSGNETEVTREVIVTIVEEFLYTGDYQTWVIPTSGRYRIEAFGAQGGGYGGKGGYAYGEIDLNKDQSIYAYVGGQGEESTFHFFGEGGGGEGGFNGGGYGGVSQDFYNRPPDDPITRAGGGGGGASDVRIGGLELSNRVIVAGGGGGTGNWNSDSNYGIGGGLSGTKGLGFDFNNVEGGEGGTQLSGGAGAPDPGGGRQVYYAATSGTLGIGGIGSSRQVYGDNAGPGGGGGGGYYGGGGGGSASSWGRGGMGGGGSSYLEGMIDDITRGTTPGVKLGNGKVVVTLMSKY